MSLPIMVFSLVLIAFLFRRHLAARSHASPAFERIAPWLVGILLTVFILLLVRGVALEYFE